MAIISECFPANLCTATKLLCFTWHVYAYKANKVPHSQQSMHWRPTAIRSTNKAGQGHSLGERKGKVHREPFCRSESAILCAWGLGRLAHAT